MPNIWGSYQVWLLSLVPVRSWGGGHTFCTIVQFNILDSILIFVPKTQLSALENRQLGSNICPGPNQLSRGPTVWGPICLEPSQLPLSCNVMRKIGKTCPLQSGFGDLFEWQALVGWWPRLSGSWECYRRELAAAHAKIWNGAQPGMRPTPLLPTCDLEPLIRVRVDVQVYDWLCPPCTVPINQPYEY